MTQGMTSFVKLALLQKEHADDGTDHLLLISPLTEAVNAKVHTSAQI